MGNLTNEVVLNAGAFLIKSLELQQAIEQSTRDYKIFWGWLYGVIIRLVEEAVPDDVAAVTQQDVIYLAEFLNNFDQNNEVGKSTENKQLVFKYNYYYFNIFFYTSGNTVIKKKFNLERVGQYLEDKNLQTQLKNDLTSEWNKLLEQNECLKNASVIYPHHKELSLIQEHNLLKTSITQLFSKPEKLIGDALKFQMCLDFADVQDNDTINLHHINVEAHNLSRFTINISQKLLYIIEYNPKSEFIQAGKLEFRQKSTPAEKFQQFDDLNLCYTQFYNENTISMLLTNTSEQDCINCFVQFPINNVQFRMLGYKLSEYVNLTEAMMLIDFYDVLDPIAIRKLELSDGWIIAVSGSRKMTSILSKTQKRVRHYEMEVEEEDDEIDMSQTNNSLDISKEST